MKHILWIMTDQHKFNALSCMGGIKGLTPNLDNLAQDGVLFENAYTPSPVCAPARAAMKTGLFPPETGMVHNWLEFKPGMRFLPQLIKEAGYRTGMVGKLHFYPPEDDFGFEIQELSDAPYSVYADDDKYSKYIEWLREKYFNQKGIDPVKLFDEDELAYDTDIRKFIMGSGFRTAEEHEVTWTTNCAIDFLQQYGQDEKPFFYYCSYFGPHQPYEAPAPYDKLYNPEEIKLPENFEADMRKHPIFEKTCGELAKRLRRELTIRDYKELIAANMGQIKMIDDAIGKIIDTLKKQQLYDQTTIIFTSDHGDHLGSYGLFFKGEMYDSCCKVPLIIKPTDAKWTGRCNKNVNTLDLYATLLEVAEATDEKSLNTSSRSLVPLLQEMNQSTIWDNKTYSIYGKDKDTAVSMIKWDELKLIRLQQNEEEALYEMYNLKEDPNEMINIYPTVIGEQRTLSMKKYLDEWFEKQYNCY